MRAKLMAGAIFLATIGAPAAALAAGCGGGGAVAGATTGAVVGGPVGAAVGGVAGAIAGCAVNPPPARVHDYIIHEQRPSVRITEDVQVGQPLPQSVEIYNVPDDQTYAYAVVNERHVVVDPQTRRVIEIYD